MAFDRRTGDIVLAVSAAGAFQPIAADGGSAPALDAAIGRDGAPGTWLVRIGAGGQVMWSEPLPARAGAVVLGVSAIAVDEMSSIVVAGLASDATGADAGDVLRRQAYVTRLDPDGQLVSSLNLLSDRVEAEAIATEPQGRVMCRSLPLAEMSGAPLATRVISLPWQSDRSHEADVVCV